jgi:hypothetical protein
MFIVLFELHVMFRVLPVHHVWLNEFATLVAAQIRGVVVFTELH